MNSLPLRVCRWLVVGILVAWLLPSVHARFIRPELEVVPVDRLAKNMQDVIDKAPKKSKMTLYNLARLHAMAYAQKTDKVQTSKRNRTPSPWFGYTPKHVPFKAKGTDDKAKLEAAQAQLDKAVETYEKVLKADPKFLPAKIGLAWSLEQKGKKDKAIEMYREILEEAWKTEKDQRRLPIGGNTITAEAGGYLVALLDKEAHQGEIATINARIAKLRKLPRPITPIVIPLRAGLGVEDLEATSASVAFDADGSGLKRSWSWVTADAGWLVHDPLRTGKITSAIQMFGNVSFWLFWENGYEALAALDDNHDGELAGRELVGLAIWRDANGNGVSEPGEVKPLREHGIVGLSCSSERLTGHADNIPYSAKGVRFRDGSTRASYDILLKAK